MGTVLQMFGMMRDAFVDALENSFIDKILACKIPEKKESRIYSSLDNRKAAIARCLKKQSGWVFFSV
jgi:hypothetical protein